jgi:hypothetical protein
VKAMALLFSLTTPPVAAMLVLQVYSRSQRQGYWSTWCGSTSSRRPSRSPGCRPEHARNRCAARCPSGPWRSGALPPRTLLPVAPILIRSATKGKKVEMSKTEKDKRKGITSLRERSAPKKSDFPSGQTPAREFANQYHLLHPGVYLI